MLLKRHFGVLVLCLANIWSFWRLAKEDVAGHYRVFISASRYLWRGVSPHGTDFGTGVGHWFYSPTCGLIAFGPFAPLSDRWGMNLYLLVSVGLFYTGFKYFSRSVIASPNDSVQRISQKTWFEQFFLLGITAQFFLALVTTKLEIAIAGILFLALGLLLKERVGLSAFLFAMVLNWKLQPLPIVGLVTVVWIATHRSFRFVAYLALGSAFWWFLPWAVKPAELVNQVYREWTQGLTSFSADSFSNFDNLYSPLVHVWKVPLTFESANLLGVGIGLMYLAGLLFWLWGIRQVRSKREILRDGIVLASALGSVFIVAFSPLSQNNSYILYSGYLAALIYLPLFRVTDRGWRMGLSLLAVFVCLTMTIAYGSLLPDSWVGVLRRGGAKQVVCFLSSLVLLVWMARDIRTQAEMPGT